MNRRGRPFDQLVADADAEASKLLRSLDEALADVRGGTSLDGDRALPKAPSERAVRRLVERIVELRATRPGSGPSASKSITAASAVEQLDPVLAEVRKRARNTRRAYDQEVGNAEEWERRAMLAVRSCDDVLAKESLARKSAHLKNAAHLRHEAEVLQSFLEGFEALVKELIAERKPE